MESTGENRAWENAIDHARLLTSTDVFWTEEENPPRLFAGRPPDQQDSKL